MNIKILYIILTVSIFVISANAQEIRGRVHAGEAGVGGIVVTDGFSCVITNSEGEYILQTDRNARFVYLSTPSGYLPAIKNSTIPIFYKEIEKDVFEYNFELHRNPKDDTHHRFIVQTDVQVADTVELNRYKEFMLKSVDFVKQLSDVDIFGFDCGDISGDNSGIIPKYVDAVSVLDIPIYRAIGNHDMNYNGRAHETSFQSFEESFGPTRYSFNKGNAHYIVLNNTFYIGREYFYIGYIDENTFQWLEQNLSFVKHDTPVFVIMHIPTRLTAGNTPFTFSQSEMAAQTINARALYELLKPYYVNIISGHMHYSANVEHNERLFEHITPAVSGAWWQGDVNLDGTPMGFVVYEVNGNSVTWLYKGFEHSIDRQFKVYEAGIYKEFPGEIVVNVWNWDSKWKVEWLEDGVAKGEMTRFSGFDADAVEMCSRELKYSWITPAKTDRLFRVKPDDKNAQIKIRVTDRFGNVFEKELKK
jgi:hypothetical protein